MEFDMSRYILTVNGRGQSDPEAAIGYDRPLQTFFPQAFSDEEGEDLAIWLGTEYRAFETLTALRAAAVAEGYDFMPLSSGASSTIAPARQSARFPTTWWTSS
jgi:hypothetical protein